MPLHVFKSRAVGAAAGAAPGTSPVYPALLVAVWVAMTLAIGPAGEFPLNDDWAYAWTVQQFVESGRLVVSDWAGATIVTQTLWGALVSSVFGFSFTALRVSAIVLGCIGTLAAFGILRTAGAGNRLAFAGALTLAVTPIYVAGAFSFNTDVPTLAAAAVAVYGFALGLRTGSAGAIVLGTVLSVASVLNRQPAIVVPAAFGLAWLLSRGISAKETAVAAAPAVIALAAHALCTVWLARSDALPWLYGYHINKLITTFSAGAGHTASVYADNAIRTGAYTGLFLFPFILAPIGCIWRRSRTKVVAVTVAGLGIGAMLLVTYGRMPYIGNVLTRFGIGPQSLPGYDALLDGSYVRTVEAVWATLTVVSAVSAVWALVLVLGGVLPLVRALKTARAEDAWALPFFAGSAIAYLFLVGGLDTEAWFDRYLLFPLPMVMAAVVVVARTRELQPGRTAAVATGLVLALTAAFTVASVHDYLSSSRAVWSGADRLMKAGVAPAAIDGGFEFRGWFSGNRIELCNPAAVVRGAGSEPDWGDFTCVFGAANRDRPYLLAFTGVDGYTIVDEITFARWLPPRRQSMFVLKRPEWFQQ